MHVKKPIEFSFISGSETVTDHMTSLSFSFGCCTFVIKIIYIVHEIGTLQDLSLLI